VPIPRQYIVVNSAESTCRPTGTEFKGGMGTGEHIPPTFGQGGHNIFCPPNILC